MAIAGGSGSGKSTLTQALVERLGEDRCSILRQGDYYLDQSDSFEKDGDINFDDPAALDFPLLEKQLGQVIAGENVEVPCYDFEHHKRKNETQLVQARPVVIVEGTMILHPKKLLEQCELSVFVSASEDIRFDRRLKRDIAERGRTEEGVRHQFSTQVKPMHDKFVEPTKACAQLVCDSEKSLKVSLEQLMKALPEDLQ